MRVLFLFLIMLSACSGFTYRSPGPYFGQPLLGTGTYLQEVKVESEVHGTYRFECIFQRKANGVLVTALSGSGKKIFQGTVSLTPETEAGLTHFPSELSGQQEELSAIYWGFRSLLQLKDKPRDPTVTDRYSDERPRRVPTVNQTELTIDEYDWGGRARKLHLRGQGFLAHITLREYTRE